ncbi:MAG: hypothetical protein AB1405_15565 [Bdellovibrionota bacterium]
MPTIHVRNVPPKLYKRLKSMAKDDQLSLAEEVLKILESAAEEGISRKRHRKALERIVRRAQRWEIPPGMPDSTELIRESRWRDD